MNDKPLKTIPDRTLQDYRVAPQTEGWRNKPHRYLYDLITEIEALRAEEDIVYIVEAHFDENWKYDHVVSMTGWTPGSTQALTSEHGRTKVYYAGTDKAKARKVFEHLRDFMDFEKEEEKCR